MEKLERVRELLSSSHPAGMSFEDVFGTLIDEYIERHSPESRIRRRIERREKARRKNESREKARRKDESRKKPRKRAVRDNSARDKNNAENEVKTVGKIGKRKNSKIPEDKGAGVKMDGKVRSTDTVRSGGSAIKKSLTNKPHSRHIPRAVRDEVWARDGGRCAYVSPAGIRCSSRWNLEIDHVVPFARGGSSGAGNLRLLCAEHNRMEAERAYGRDHMKRFYKDR